MHTSVELVLQLVRLGPSLDLVPPSARVLNAHDHQRRLLLFTPSPYQRPVEVSDHQYRENAEDRASSDVRDIAVTLNALPEHVEAVANVVWDGFWLKPCDVSRDWVSIMGGVE